MIKFYIIYPFIFIVFMMLSFKVFAEEIEKNNGLFSSPVWQKFCQAYISHTPKYNVEYKSGVDIHGGIVAPADLQEGGVIKPPKIIEFDLDINLAKYLGIGVPNGLLGEAKMGSIRIEDGQVYFNGEKIDDTKQTGLYDVCNRKIQNKIENENKASYTNLEIFKNGEKLDDSKAVQEEK